MSHRATPFAATNPCIVHELGDLAPAHISGNRPNTLCTSAGFLSDLRFGALQILPCKIRYADVHSKPRKRLCGSEPDAARAAADDRRTAPSQRRMRAHSY